MAAALLVVAALVGCGGASDDAAPDLGGHRIEVLAVWSGDEQAAFETVLRGFEEATGAAVDYTSAGHGMATALSERVDAGDPPDVAFVPQPGLLRRYAREGKLVALDDAVGEVVDRNYAPVWRELGSEGGRLFGVWFKAANKSLVWYNVGVFERLGVVPPVDLDGLAGVAARTADAGVPAFSVAGADGWTLTDWFENLYLRLAGPDRYDLLARHAIPWTDGSVRAALRALDGLLAARLVAGGVDGALATEFEPSVRAAFADPPGAAMVFEGDFVAGVVTAATDAELGVDADVFPFPRAAGSGDGAAAAVVGGGDAAVLLRPSPAGRAFLRYLATPEAAARWAAQGGFVSPNRNLELTAYPDELTRSLARSVLDAGDDFRFDLSDLAPAAFGGTEGRGLRANLQEFLLTRDVDATVARLEAEAAAAYGEPR